MPAETVADLERRIKATGGVPVSLGADSTYGHEEIADQVAVGSGTVEVVGTAQSVVVPTGALSGIATGAAITVDGASYTVRDHRREEDGKLTRILLRSA